MTAAIHAASASGRETFLERASASGSAALETSPSAAAAAVALRVDRRVSGGGKRRRLTKPGTISRPIIGYESN